MNIHTHTGYIAYLRSLAETHKNIKHSKNESHFARLTLTASPFVKEAYIQEFISSLKSKIHFPAMLVENYTANYDDQGGDNIIKYFDGCFILLDIVRADDFDAEESVMDRMEAVAEEMLGKIWNDIREQYDGMALMEFNRTGIEKLAKICGKYFGVRVDFCYLTGSNNNLNFNPNNWQ